MKICDTVNSSFTSKIKEGQTSTSVKGKPLGGQLATSGAGSPRGFFFDAEKLQSTVPAGKEPSLQFLDMKPDSRVSRLIAQAPPFAHFTATWAAACPSSKNPGFTIVLVFCLALFLCMSPLHTVKGSKVGVGVGCLYQIKLNFLK